MINIRQVYKLCSKHLSNGLMPKTHAEHGFAPFICSNDVEKQSGFFRNAGARTQNDLVKLFKLWQLKLVIAHNGHVGTKLLHKV